jgi:hypothetical protein
VESPLHPNERTYLAMIGSSESCQQRKLAGAAGAHSALMPDAFDDRPSLLDLGLVVGTERLRRLLVTRRSVEPKVT